MNEAVIRLEPSRIPAAMRLSEAAGWNQNERDWLRLLQLEPEGCFGLLCGDALASTATAVCYGSELAWIGMVLTGPEFRGRGYARRLMECALAFAERRGAAWVKLDATEMGRPLYQSLGFEEEQPVERWVVEAARAEPREAPPWTPLSELDRRAFGADRGALLEGLATGESAALPGEGYAMGRPGSRWTYFGPCVCGSPEAARHLLQWFLGRHAGESVGWDLLPGNAAAGRMAREFGFERRRRLTRMFRRGKAGRPLRRRDGDVYAIAGFEYG